MMYYMKLRNVEYYQGYHSYFEGTWGHGPTKIPTAKHFESAE